MNSEVMEIIEKIKVQYEDVDTILLFGSATTSDWNNESDIDVFLIDDSFSDSRFETKIDGVVVEFQKDNFINLEKDIKKENGKLLNRNVATMIAAAEVISTKSQERVAQLMDCAKKVLASSPKYDDEDVKMWKYSIKDYLAKAKKDVAKNDEVAFYFHAHYVLQNALEMALAINDAYMPQPKYLTKLLEEKDPRFLDALNNYLASNTLTEKLAALTKIEF